MYPSTPNLASLQTVFGGEFVQEQHCDEMHRYLPKAEKHEFTVVRRDNQGENPATIRMRMRRCWGDEGRAEPDLRRPSSGGVCP